MIGTTVLQYRIESEIGRGGMGVVYKAHDTKLDRVVALKFLPQNLTTTDTERARFLQEAKAAAALSHPNVCVIHEIHDAGETPFIVMEFVEGQTIREIVSKGSALPPEQAIDHAIAICDALHEAHQKAIVHRDIKSDNIMVDARGRVKVMDFGLAKLKGGQKLTKMASTLGTLAYMAPEQVQGEEVDARSDIFSVGVVLFEMLTGALPFQGDYDAAIMFSILNEAPEPLQKYVPAATSELVHVLNRALEKAPGDRYQSLGDMQIDLKRCKREATTGSDLSADRGSTPPVLPTEPIQSAAGPSQRKPLQVVGGAVVIFAIVAALIALLKGGGGPSLNPDMTFRVLSTPYPEIWYSSLSDDGNWVAFPAIDDNNVSGVYFMNSAGGETRRIATNPSNIRSLDISPDGSTVAYSNWFHPEQQQGIFVVSSLGGSAKLIAPDMMYPVWRPDGERIGLHKFVGDSTGKREVWSVRADGSDLKLEYVDYAGLAAGGRLDFSWSPDGSSIAWLRTFSRTQVEIIIVDLATGKERQLTFDENIIDEVTWTRQNAIIYSSTKSGNTNLWMVSASGGEPVQITKGSGPDIGSSISADGSTLLYLQKNDYSSIWRTSADGSASRQLTFQDELLERPVLSPDGEWISYVKGSPDPAKWVAVGELFVMDRDGSKRRHIRSEQNWLGHPRWSANGKWLAYQFGVERRQSSVHVVSTKAGQGTTLKVDIPAGHEPRWIDVNTLLFYKGAGRRYFSTWMVSLDGIEPVRVYADSTKIIPVAGQAYFFIADWRAESRGGYVLAGPDFQAERWQNARHIVDSEELGRVEVSGPYLLDYRGPGDIWRISVPDGERQKLGGAFTDPKIAQRSVEFSRDGKEAVYQRDRIASKLVLIENFTK